MDRCPPVLMHPEVRDRYDRLWSLYPWEHPSAYWLRCNEEAAVCTRCGRDRFEMAAHSPSDHDAFAVAFEAWVAVHLRCELGEGFGSPVADPLFEEVS